MSFVLIQQLISVITVRTHIHSVLVIITLRNVVHIKYCTVSPHPRANDKMFNTGKITKSVTNNNKQLFHFPRDTEYFDGSQDE